MQMHNPAHPGAILTDTIGGVTVEQLASTLGLTVAETEELLRGERDITPEMAERLPALYPNQPPEMWLRLQRQRDEWFTLSRYGRHSNITDVRRSK